MFDRPTLMVISSTINQQSPLLLPLQQELNIVFADNSGAVIDISSQERPVDLVLLDISNDRDSAYEACMWLKTDNASKGLPIIVIDDQDQDASRWLNAGAVDYLCLTAPANLVIKRINSHLELKAKNQLLANIASLDPLTSLVDRARFNEYLALEWRRSLREFYPLSMIKIDIDSFTAYNDHHGLGCGDDVLKRVARALGGHCNRAADMLSRYCRDEFIVLLPGTELDNALIVAGRMVASVRELAIEHQGLAAAGPLTISIGVATIEPSRDGRRQDLFDEVEEVLYRAQQAGGNQVQGIAL